MRVRVVVMPAELEARLDRALATPVPEGAQEALEALAELAAIQAELAALLEQALAARSPAEQPEAPLQPRPRRELH
jgi:hypothetical protein